MLEKSQKYKLRQILFTITVFAIVMAIIMLGSSFLSNEKRENIKEVHLPKVKYEDRKEVEERSFKKTYGEELVLLKRQLNEQKQEIKSLKKQKEQEKLQSKKKNFLGKPLSNANTLSINVPPPSSIQNKLDIKPTVVKYSIMNDNIYISSKTNSKIPSNSNINNKMVNAVSVKDDKNISDQKDKIKKSIKIPAGSFIKGVLLNGIDAPTASNAKGNPHPVAIRFIDKSILPNNFKADIKDCVAIAGGYGELSSQRAIIRVDKVSCVKEDGTVLTSKGNSIGYVTGEDGKVGLEGEVISRQGAIIARAMAADFFSGISGVLKQANQPQTAIAQNGTTSTPTIKTDEAMKVGLFSGLSGATSKLSDFYLKLNDQMFPVVEIAVGRTCDIIFNKTLILEEEK
jgi:conjugal transfer pilus assembly protein TraB